MNMRWLYSQWLKKALARRFELFLEVDDYLLKHLFQGGAAVLSHPAYFALNSCDIVVVVLDEFNVA